MRSLCPQVQSASRGRDADCLAPPHLVQVRAPAERPWLGYGLGLRKDHYQAILDTQPAVDWFEIISENYFCAGGMPLHYLEAIRRDYPLVMHGVSLSIGSTDPIDFAYLTTLKALADRIDAAWISDHLCWTGVDGLNLHDLLPLPYTAEALAHVAARVRRVQDFLGRRILLENASSYVSFSSSTLTEWEFLHELAVQADCLLLLDINNVYVSAYNHGFDPVTYLAGIPAERVWQVHLAGHSDYGTHIVDTHDQAIAAAVWDLYDHAIHRFGAISTMIERDDNIPPLPILLAELAEVRRRGARVLAPCPPAPPAAIR